MRPNILAGCLWALWSCGLLYAQTTRGSHDQNATDQRPSSLRDSGVIMRATPPETMGGSNPATLPSAQPTRQPPTSFPTPASTNNPAGFGDRAWVGSPSAVQPVAASQPVRPLNSHPGDPSATSQVVPAQFVTANDPSKSGSAQAIANGREPRPLKPPSRPENTADTQGSSTGTLQMFVSVLSSLAIVIGLILAAAWFYRKAAPKITGALPKQVVQVLGRTPLAPRQQLVLLRLGSKLVLVSNLHGEVRTISEITDPLEVDRLAGLCEAAQPGSISDSFRSVLHNMGRNG